MDSPARARLGAAVRALADLIVRSGAADEDVDAAAAAIERITDRLQAAPPVTHVHDSPYHSLSLVGGRAHPIAPQLHTERTGDGVAGEVTLGPAFEGGPGLAHGGIVSLLFDHAMGQALFVSGHHAMTVTLQVRYVAPTPLGVPLRVRAWVDRVDGRRLHVAGEISANGTVTARAEAVFLQLTPDNVARIFPADRVPPHGHRRVGRTAAGNESAPTRPD